MEKALTEGIDFNKLPVHVAIIMDGNGRWARQHGMPRLFGHKAGVKSVREVTEAAAELGINYLTLYAFSTENWNRPELEVLGLMSLLVETIQSELKTLQENKIRLLTIGDLSKLPERTKSALLKAIEDTSGNTGLNLVLALNYSSRWEILSAVNRIIEESKNAPDTAPVDENRFTTYLSTAGIPEPELLIRTSGEHRISNFLLWQMAYTEFYFTPVFWPDFRKAMFCEAIRDYQKRQRRFGKTSEQISHESSSGGTNS
jgi:undecaprenyl diphosphate synthase